MFVTLSASQKYQPQTLFGLKNILFNIYIQETDCAEQKCNVSPLQTLSGIIMANPESMQCKSPK